MSTAIGSIHMSTLQGRTDAPRDRADVLPDSKAAANQISKTFAYQSYFDSTFLERAVLPQAPNNPIVQSTLEQQQLSGQAIGNHPDSQTPVAVLFSGEGRQSGSAIHIIPPGGIVRPAGDRITSQSAFQSFSWGLPFGWLGGGTATISVFQTPQAWANWVPGVAQVLFHRFRARIYAPADLPVAADLSDDWPRNWPIRFPSLLTARGGAVGIPTIPQGGSPQIAITRPGQTLLTLQRTVGAATSMKAVFYHTTDFSDELSAQPAPIPLYSIEFTVPARTPYAYTAGYTEYTTFEGPAELSRLGCDGKTGSAATLTAGVVFVSDDPALQGQYLDVARYGYL